ncbi:MAG: glutathione S-transferase family protein [Proteobacteria bacterium]|nr:glutathione S-transferase family protein [Pseudomonadota bacterium]
MILVGQMDSPFLRRVAVTMNHYRLPFERKPLSVFKDLKALSAINPLGKVPALVLDDNETLFDSQMILDYLDETAGPDVSLTPPAGEDRRKVLRIATVALGIAEKVVALNIETRIRAEGTTDPRIVRRYEGQVKSGLQWLEAEAPNPNQGPDQDPWFMGPAITQADVTAASVLTHMHEKRPELFSPETTPALAALRMRAEALEIFKASPFEEA